MTPEEQLHAVAWAESPPPPRTETARARRVSAPRIAGIGAVVLLAVVAGLALRSPAPSAVAVTESGFSPYVDVTATPLYGFERPPGGHPGDAVLGFVVSSRASACTPSWGAAYSLDQAAGTLDLDRRVARLRQLGGDVVPSFGGAANSELARGCTDPIALTAAYRSVVERYSAETIDLDIEGAPSSAPEVNARRALAIGALQGERRRSGRPLGVWLTLPVGPDGLTTEGRAVLDAFLAADVRLAGVNAMVMDYGASLPAGRSLASQAELSLIALHQQLRSAYAADGAPLTSVGAWQLVGATPMIGQNDTPGEVFDLAAARQLVGFARTHRLRRISMWAANRDQGCGPNYPDLRVVSGQCSGVAQQLGAFAAIFRRFAPVAEGVAASPADPAGVTAVASATAAGAPQARATTADDPATSPYPIWNDHQAYAQGTKIVWRHNVYEAKWYSQGSQPDAPVTDAWQTPWSLIGPVMPGEHPVPLPTLKAGTYPRWNAATAYRAGSRVLRDHVGYQAKWWTRGDVPGTVLDSPYDSPWQLIKAD